MPPCNAGGRRLLVAPGLCLLLDLLDACLNGLEVFQLKLGVDDFLVADGVHRAVDVGDVVVVKAAQYVEDGVRLAYVGKELVAQSFPLAGSLDQSGDVDNLDGGRHDASRVDQLGELVQSFIGDGDDTDVGFNGAEGEIGRFGTGFCDGIEKGALPYIWKAHNANLQICTHENSLLS